MKHGDVRTLTRAAKIWKIVEPGIGSSETRFPGGVGREGALFISDVIIIFETAEYWVQVLYVSKKGLELGWVRKEYLK